MKDFIRYIIISISFLLITLLLNAQEKIVKSDRWDQNIIMDAKIWPNLLVNYIYEDRILHWPKRKQALTKVIVDFPNSKWADDAALLLAGQQAVLDNNLDVAILGLREIIKKYPLENTIVVSWNSLKGCQINEGWLMWAPSLVAFNVDFSVRATFPFDKDGIISILEAEVLTYFEHLERYPQRTKDVAQYIIALMLRQKGDIAGAISELEDLQIAYPDLSKIRTIDFEAAKKENGHLIESEPPFDATPIWRVQYTASLLLIDLYLMQKNKDKVLDLSKRIELECSPNGWYWNINKYLGNIYSQFNLLELASEQYDLSIKGIRERSKSEGIRLNTLFEKGYVIKPKDFISWEDEALKSHLNTISEIKDLQDKLHLDK
jgi:hypothetical protein